MQRGSVPHYEHLLQLPQGPFAGKGQTCQAKKEISKRCTDCEFSSSAYKFKKRIPEGGTLDQLKSGNWQKDLEL